MSWNYNLYKEWLYNRLNEIRVDLGFNTFNLEVVNELDFTTDVSLEPKNIIIAIKYLQDSKLFTATAQPIQFMILAEENSIETARTIFLQFEERYNLAVIQDLFDGAYIKQEYTNPVDFGNFQIVGAGYRSVLEVYGTLFILEGVIDLTDLQLYNAAKEEYEDINAIATSLGYSMTPDTQAFSTEKIAISTKSVSTMAFTVSVPCVKSEITDRALKIMNKVSSGNEVFSFKFNIGEIAFTQDFKLLGCDFISAVNEIPSISLRFIV